MAATQQTPYLRLNLNGDEELNRNWAIVDDLTYRIAAGEVASLIGPGTITQPMLAKPSVGSPELVDQAVTSSKIADGTIQRADISATIPLPPTYTLPADAGKALVIDAGGNLIWTAPPAGAPSGPASGDLTGLYPGPTIAPLAVTNAKISDVAWNKISGAPASFPPSGTAGGDLAGSYPNPTLKAGVINDADVTDVGWSKITGAPTSLPPSGTAGGSLTGTYPNPTLAANSVVTASIQDGQVTALKLAAGAAVRTVINGSVTASSSATTTPVKFATVAGTNLNGRTNLVFLNTLLAIAVVAAGQGFAIKVQRNAVDLLQWGGNCGAGAATEFPLPTFLCFFDTTAPSGTVTYDWYFWTASSGTNIHVPGSTQGQTQIVSYS